MKRASELLRGYLRCALIYLPFSVPKTKLISVQMITTQAVEKEMPLILSSGLWNVGAVLEFGKLKSIFEMKEVYFGFWSQTGISE